eukprot:scaffold11589_cov117-Cylindrotheca_fusiformis.AAC.13
MTSTYGSSLSQNQRPSPQVQASRDPGQSMPGSASASAQMPMNPNDIMAAQYLNMQPPRQRSNLVATNEIPSMMNGQGSARANCSMQQMSQWVAGQPIPPQSVQYPVSGLVAQNGFAGNVDQDSMLHAISPKSAIIPADASNQPIIPGSSKRPLQQKGKSSKKDKKKAEAISSTAKVKQSRERNREHARSTRLRKKAYVQQLKEMADGLRVVQTEEIRRRRTAVQKKMSDQKARRTLIQTALEYHASAESDPLKWAAIVEESFWFKQPVTPFRSFRRSEVEKDCRIVRGIDAMICEAASLSVMVERIGYRSARWQQIKCKKLMDRLEQSAPRLSASLVAGIDQSLLAESSLSGGSSIASSNGSSASRNRKRDHSPFAVPYDTLLQSDSNNVRSASSNTNGSKENAMQNNDDGSADSAAVDIPIYPNAKRSKTSSVAGSQEMSNMFPQPGGVVHEVRSSNDDLKSQPRIHRPPNMELGSYNVFSNEVKEIECYYATNEDDMIIIDDIIMCPFIFRSRNAVLCGALADCIMPGMLRANFSKSNKIQDMEIIYDAMGFMQQLDGASGRQVNAQVIPGSLETALMDCPNEARVITEARAPFGIVHVNEAWSKMTKYSQMDVEGEPLLPLIEGDGTDSQAGLRMGKPIHKLEEVAKGRPACSTNLHYGKDGISLCDFMSSYPLTKNERKGIIFGAVVYATEKQ